MHIAICTLAPVKNTLENEEENSLPVSFRLCCPYNIYLLAAIMEQGGYEIAIKDWNGKVYNPQEMFNELLNFDVIMFSTNSWNWHPIRCLIEKLRSMREDQIIVIGGLQATIFGQKITEEFPVNYVVRGEGEKSVIPLLRLIEKKGREDEVPGLVYKKNGEIHLNPMSPLMTPEEMALLPVPLYEKLQDKTYDWLSIESSRGCVNNCIYCAVPYKRNWRPLSAKAFVDHIEAYIPYLGKVSKGKFFFIDDSFIIDVNRAREIAGLLRKRKIDIKAIWHGHVMELFEREMLTELAPYTDIIIVGAESFHEETLKKIGKTFKPEDILKGTGIAVKAGISKKLLFSFIIGFPWQNKEIIIEEINQIYDLVSTTDACALINWLTLNPGSQIWNEFYGKKKVPLRDYGKLYDEWGEEASSLNSQEKEEINFYIRYLQNTIPCGKLTLAVPIKSYKILV
jgi:radical SAM superfamily enzyme YgiQ (UPF0313 family)